MKAETIQKSCRTAKRSGHKAGRVAAGVTAIGVGGTGAAGWGFLTGCVEIIKELLPEGEPEVEEEEVAPASTSKK